MPSGSEPPAVQAMLTVAGSYPASVSIAASHPKAETAPTWYSERIDGSGTGNRDNHSRVGRKGRPGCSAEVAWFRAENRRFRCRSDRGAGNGIREIVSPSADPPPTVALTRRNRLVEQPESGCSTDHPEEGIAAVPETGLSPVWLHVADFLPLLARPVRHLKKIDKPHRLHPAPVKL